MNANTIIAAIALLLGGINSYLIYRQSKKQLNLDILRLQTEFGTIEDIDAEIRNLRIENERKKSEILTKWTNEQGRRASDLANRGMSHSSEADRMINEIKEGRKSELQAEERDYRLKLQKLNSKRKLLKDKLDKLK